MNTEATAITVIDAPQIQGRGLTIVEQETLGFHARNALSENTRLAYERQWKAFVKWCRTKGFTPFPAETSTVMLYLDWMVKDTEDGKGLRFSSVEQALAAIKFCHLENMGIHQGAVHTVQALSMRNVAIRNMLNSLKRVLAARGAMTTIKPRCFTQNEIRAMVQAMPDTPQGKQDKAILLLGVNAGLRASEYCALIPSNITPDGKGMDVFIQDSKSDQFGEGETLYVGRLAPMQHDFDATKAMEEWIACRKELLRTLGVMEATANTVSGAVSDSEAPGASSASSDSLPLFLAFRKGGKSLHLTAGKAHGITREAITDVVLRCMERAGEAIGPSDKSASSHSLRHTFVTQAFSRGSITDSDIARTSRHKSMTVLQGYNQQSRRSSTVAPRLWA